MTKMMFLLLAAFSPAATWGQKGTAEAVTSLGARYCGHTMDAGTLVDARARNASREEAVVIRWLDPKGAAVHSALFMGRCIAKDGDNIDGKMIVRVLPNSLAVSDRHGLTAYEAEYRENYGPLGDGPSHRGTFIENRFVTELDASKGSDSDGVPDFRWNEEQETLTLKPGVVPPPAPVHYSYQTAPLAGAQSAPAQAPAPAAKPCSPQAQGPKVGVRVPKKPSAWACKTLGICTDDTPVVLNGDNGCPAAPASGQRSR